jgi:hypothetical protein
VSASLLITNNTAIFGTLAGHVYGLSTSTGAILWQLRPDA